MKHPATIDIYNVFGNYVESQEISAAEGYKYYAYAIFEAETVGENYVLWDWYKGYEQFYNTDEECIRELERAHIGKYKIAAIYQDQLKSQCKSKILQQCNLLLQFCSYKMHKKGVK